MKSILIGGFERAALNQMRQAFAPIAQDYNVTPVSGLADLERLLEPLQGDLLILNFASAPLAMLDWVAAVARVRASIPLVCVGSNQKSIYQAYTQRFPDLYFPQMEVLPNSFTDQELLGVVRVAICDTAWGVIGGLSLSTLLQMIHMERKTCTIRVISGRRQGFLYIRSGDVINARYRRREGLDAAYLLLASDSPRAEISGLLHDGTQRIELSIEELLMNAAQIQDEQTDPTLSEPSQESVDHLPISEQGKWKAPESKPASPPKSPRRTGLLALAASLILIAGLGTAMMAGRKKTIQISSHPAKATVSIDGTPCGETPLTLNLGKREGSLRIEAPGYQPMVRQITSQDRELNFDLTPLPSVATSTEPTAISVVEPDSEPVTESSRSNRTHKEKPKAEKKAKGDIFDQVRNQ